MTKLGEHLIELRKQKDRSRRWVERQSQILFPNDRARQISHTYLRQIEKGEQPRPKPLKLKTLAKIYKTDTKELLEMAGHLDSEPALLEALKVPGAARELLMQVKPKGALAQKLFKCLEINGIPAENFVHSMGQLSEESLQLINQLVTALNIEENKAKLYGHLEAQDIHEDLGEGK